MKDIVILGGPNGAGKTTAAKILLPEKLGLIEFINADEIARGLSPFDVDRAALSAGRLMIARMRSLLDQGRSFALETTCSGRMYLRLLKQAKADGWRVNLLFLWLASPDIALSRVARRVEEGGHAIPSEVVIRRYWAGLANMRQHYLPLADTAAIYDNGESRKLIAERKLGGELVVHEPSVWAEIESAHP